MFARSFLLLTIVHFSLAWKNPMSLIMPSILLTSSRKASHQCELSMSLKASSSSDAFVVATTTMKDTINTNYPLKNDLILRAARGEKVERTPIWVFRQAGRHLPEYMQYKAAKGKNFLELLDDPADVTECTLQPVRRYPVDAAILFSDILVLLQAMDVEVTMPGGQGIMVPHPITSPCDYNTRIPSTIDIREKLPHVLTAVTQIKEALKGQVPLIGFSAAPWTLFFYLVGGSSKKNQAVASQWLRDYPDESGKILDKFTDMVIEYMVAQVEHGADLLQLFEAMGEFLTPADFTEWALPRLQRIATSIKARCPGVPLMVFPRGACYSIVQLQQAGFDVISIDTETSAYSAREQLAVAKDNSYHQTTVLQGNFDVKWLQRSSSTVEEDVQKVKMEVRKMLEAYQTPQHLIANLGEGLSGKEDPVLVKSFVDSVHEISEEMIHAGK